MTEKLATKRRKWAAVATAVALVAAAGLLTTAGAATASPATPLRASAASASTATPPSAYPVVKPWGPSGYFAVELYTTETSGASYTAAQLHSLYPQYTDTEWAAFGITLSAQGVGSPMAVTTGAGVSHPGPDGAPTVTTGAADGFIGLSLPADCSDRNWAGVIQIWDSSGRTIVGQVQVFQDEDVCSFVLPVAQPITGSNTVTAQDLLMSTNAGEWNSTLGRYTVMVPQRPAVNLSDGSTWADVLTPVYLSVALGALPTGVTVTRDSGGDVATISYSGTGDVVLPYTVSSDNPSLVPDSSSTIDLLQSPVAVDHSFQATVGDTVTISASQLRAGSSSYDPTSSLVAVVAGSAPGATISTGADGSNSVAWTPPATGTYRLMYSLKDPDVSGGGATSAPATITLNVVPAAGTPVTPVIAPTPNPAPVPVPAPLPAAPAPAPVGSPAPAQSKALPPIVSG
ncbi:MAG: hypothetical protein JWM49_627 [Microbacteriaceae bacterium]|nr:hypothetical protein [Microbacteriaceae bacterium]